jgi:hypothetical protein
MKDDILLLVLIGAVCFLFGGLATYGQTKQDIAEQCKRQGGFYVGKDDFKCEVKK